MYHLWVLKQNQILLQRVTLFGESVAESLTLFPVKFYLLSVTLQEYVKVMLIHLTSGFEISSWTQSNLKQKLAINLKALSKR